MMTDKVQLFENQPIRTAWVEDEEEWYFSIVDVAGVLTESKDPTTYWRKLKQRLKEEGNETVTNCHALKMTAKDGRKRFTDVANTEQLLRIIQSIPSKKAEPFKMWLAFPVFFLAESTWWRIRSVRLRFALSSPGSLQTMKLVNES